MVVRTRTTTATTTGKARRGGAINGDEKFKLHLCCGAGTRMARPAGRSRWRAKEQQRSKAKEDDSGGRGGTTFCCFEGRRPRRERGARAGRAGGEGWGVRLLKATCAELCTRQLPTTRGTKLLLLLGGVFESPRTNNLPTGEEMQGTLALLVLLAAVRCSIKGMLLRKTNRRA